MLTSQEMYESITSGDRNRILHLWRQLPEIPMKDSGVPLLSSDDELDLLMAFGILLPGYCNGADTRAGENLGLAMYRMSKEMLLSGNYPYLMMMTVSGFAFNYATSLNYQAKYEEMVQFIDNEKSFWDHYKNNPPNLAQNDFISFIANYKSLLVAKTNALLQLDRIDEAEQLANDPELKGNWASDIELNRLKALIEQRKTPIHQILTADDRKELQKIRQMESQDSIHEALKKMMQSQGFSGELVKQLDEVFQGDSIDGSNAEGFSQLEKILTQGEKMLQQGGTDVNEISLRQQIRRASGIFVGRQPDAKEIERSLSELKSVLPEATAVKNVALINDALYGLYLCYSRLKNHSLAADQLIQLRKNLETTRRGIQDPSLRGGVFQTYPYLFSATVEQLFLSNRFADMLDAMEGAKGRMITDTLERQLSSEVPVFEPWNVAARMAPVLQKEKFHYVSFYLDDECSYAFFISSQGQISASRVDVTRKKVLELVTRNLIDPREWFEWQELKILDQLKPLVGWLEPLLANGTILEGDHICYSTDDLLYLFPISYLPLKGKRAIEWFSLSRVHNADHLLYLLSRERVVPTTALTVSVPSTADKKDSGAFSRIADEVRRLLPNTESLRDEAADISTILQHCSGRQLIQINSHGIYVKNKNPFTQSGLLVADHGRLPTLSTQENHSYADDGEHLLSPQRLLDSQFKTISLNHAHVSLQACVSGYSLEGVAGDAIGLEWAFLQKGAGSLLSSFWSVEVRSTIKFFNSFYQRWLENSESKAMAFRNAVLELKAEAPASNTPEYYWAGFELIGDWR